MPELKTSAPRHLWVVGVASLAAFGWGATFGAAYALTGALRAGADFLWPGGLGAGPAGAVALLLRRKLAGPLFLATGMSGLASLGFLMAPGPGDPGPMIIAVNGMFLAVGGALLLLYARAMARRSVLG